MTFACRLHDAQEPWEAVSLLPEFCIEMDNRLTCMAAERGTVIVGSEEGQVEAWHLLTQENLWQVG